MPTTPQQPSMLWSSLRCGGWDDEGRRFCHAGIVFNKLTVIGGDGAGSVWKVEVSRCSCVNTIGLFVDCCTCVSFHENN